MFRDEESLLAGLRAYMNPACGRLALATLWPS